MKKKKVKTPTQRVREWRERNKNKLYAQRMVFTAVRNKSIKKSHCVICNDINVEAHHPNYNEPLVVMWLCKKHHILEHKMNRMGKSLSTG
jgi:hypothetical protein